MKFLLDQLKIFPMNIFGFLAWVVWGSRAIATDKIYAIGDLPLYMRVLIRRDSTLLSIVNWGKKPLEIQAVTIGSYVFVREDLHENEELLRHECKHVLDQQKWSVAYAILYLYYGFKALALKKQFYWDNEFEIAARKFASPK